VRKATHTKILPDQHQACRIATAVQLQQRIAKESLQDKDACKAAVQKRCERRLVNRLLILGFLVTRSLVFAECPRPFRAPGVGRISEFSDDLTTQLDATIARPGLSALSFLSLMVLLGIVVNGSTARQYVQPRRKEPQLSTRAVRNLPNQEGTL
jgi:hypothetical protein